MKKRARVFVARKRSERLVRSVILGLQDALRNAKVLGLVVLRLVGGGVRHRLGL